MKFTGLMAAMAALSLVAAPTMAAAAPVPVQTALTQPAVENVDGDNALRGGGFFIAIIALVVVIAGIVIVARENDKPNSP